MKQVVAVAAALLALLFASSAGAATLRLTPAQARPGSTVIAVGSGFPGARAGTITLGGRVVALFATSRRGAFTRRFHVPRLPGGAKRVVASVPGGRVGSVFTIGLHLDSSVTANSTGQRILLTPTGGKTGTWVNVSGAGFGPGALVRVFFAGAMQTSLRTNGRGAFTAAGGRFTLPPSALGARLVAVSSGRRLLSAPYRVRRCGATAAYLPVCTPYTNEFRINAGGKGDKNGVGTGFNVVSPPASGTGYVPANLTVNRAAGSLSIKTTAGLATSPTNTQANMLGVGIAPGNGPADISTTILNPPNPAAAATSEQGGLWFGNDQNNFVKLVLLNTAGGPVVQLRMRVNGGSGSGPGTKAITLPAGALNLSLNADPATQRVTGKYSVNGGAMVTVGSVNAPSAFFSSDQAGIDPAIGTKTFAGIFASHRTGPSPLTYTFGNFVLTVQPPPPPPPPSGGFTFNRFSIGAAIQNATAMTFGPDGRLYTTDLLGTIHALTLNSSHKVTNDQVIADMGMELTLGIAVDPASTAGNVILWVAYSSPELSSPNPATGIGGAPANSGAIAKITVDPVAKTSSRSADPITGLPRSQANHATNAVHFKGGKLYIAQSGNTGAGAPNNSQASLGEFGWREEQPLSAAILVADVKAAGFDGTCDNTGVSSYTFHGEAIYGANPCDVHPYATGFRNAYDFVWHSNGSLYAPDNGASVGPTYPKSPTPPCEGLSPTSNNTGDQSDLLLRVVQGKYYGHPNPHRIEPNGPECVFKDGSLQGVSPLSWYQSPLFDLGAKHSADGIIEYKGSAFGGALDGNLLLTYYSQGDYVARVQLSPDGTSVVGSPTNLAGSFNNPLPITEGPDGTFYVGEFGDPGAGNAGKITALVPTG